MNAKAAPPDLDQLADQLADHDGTDAEAPDSTLKELKQELDTLAVQVAQPAPADEFGSESALERGIEFVKEIGRELSATATIEVQSNHPPAEELGTIREYRLLAKLGEGGMGAVYKALHTKLDRVVALKILPGDRLQNEAAVARFEREMKAVGKLEHPNIVAARDAGEIDGTHYLVMELVDGIDLSNLVRQVGPAVSSVGWTSKSDQEEADGLGSPSCSGVMTIPDACEMIRQAAVGLQEAHEDGMVHRDIKPSNLMLARSRKGRKPPLVKVLDMGLALLDDHRGKHRDLTGTGQMMGTLDYMAPEQGMDSHQVDIRADIYSLGATLYKLLTGQPPFPSSQYDTPVKMMMALATKQAPSIATVRDDLPTELIAIVDRMLAKNPDDRFTEPEEVAEALVPFCEGCDLALLLKKVTAEDAETAEEESKVGTHESLKSNSVETAPTIDVQSNTRARREESGAGVAGVEQSESPAAFPSTATTAAKPGVSSALGQVARSADLDTAHKGRWYTIRRNQILTAAALVGFVLLSTIVFYIKTNHGTIVVEIDDPAISVTVQGEDIEITKGDSGEAYKITPGERTLHVKRGDLEFDTDKFTLRKGETVVLTVRLVEGQVQVVQKNDNRTVIGSSPLSHTKNFALAFDGKASHVKTPVSFDGKSPFTMEAWITVAEDTRAETIIAQAGPPHAHLFRTESNKLATSVQLPLNHQEVGSNEIDSFTKRRIHVAGVFYGSDVSLFVEGKQTNRPSHVEQKDLWTKYSDYPTGDAFIIGWLGGKFAKHESFHGIIDEVRISNVARYDKDFTPAERFEPDEHTLALYHFDEGQGDIAHDSSGNKHHGKIVGAKWVKVEELNDESFFARPNRDLRDISLRSATTDRLADLEEPQLIGKLVLNDSPLTDEDLHVFKEMINLETLQLQASGVTDSGLQHLSEFSNLQTLSLRHTNITGVGFAALEGKIPRLHGLSLNETQITDNGLHFVVEFLKAKNDLGILDLRNTQVTDAGISQLAELNQTGINTIQLEGNDLSAVGVARLKQVLPRCQIASDFTSEEIKAATAKIEDVGTNSNGSPLFAPNSLAYILQTQNLAKDREGVVEALSACGRDLIVIDDGYIGKFGGKWSEDELDRIRQGKPGRRILAYLSIGLADVYRGYWRKEWDNNEDGNPDSSGPAFLIGERSKWPAYWHVKFWDAQWQNIILGIVDQTIEQGFDGVWLDLFDVIDSFEKDGGQVVERRENPDTGNAYRQDMIDWITTIAGHAREQNPNYLIVPLNGGQLVGDPAYSEAISGMAVESLFISDGQKNPKAYTDAMVKRFEQLPAEKPILLIEYTTEQPLQNYCVDQVQNARIVLLFTEPELNKLGTSVVGSENP